LSSQNIVTIDGPGGAGKSTLAKLLAGKLGWAFLDTGAIYRTVALVLIERGLTEASDEEAGRIADQLDLSFRLEGHEQRLYLAGRNLGVAIRTPEVTKLASRISSLPAVRTALLSAQRRLGERGQLVTEGRDMGTVVFPGAKLKFFLDADPEIRAKRRFDELKAKSAQVPFCEVLAELKARDQRDQNRTTAPLTRAPEAVVIDSSQLSQTEVFDLLYEKTKEVFNL
jgi:cytidylate kinase